MTTPSPQSATRTVTAVIPPGAPLLQQFDLPADDGVIGDMLVGLSTALLDGLGSPGAVKVTVTVEAAPVPTEEQQTEDPRVVVG